MQAPRCNLPWTASLRAVHKGKKVKDFGLRDVALSAEQRKAFYVELDTTDFTLPVAYDARDIYAGQTPCKAYPGAEPVQLRLVLRLRRGVGLHRAPVPLQLQLDRQHPCLTARDDGLQQ